MHQLNPQQQQAATYLTTPLLVLAGAGSGKTRVITEKIAHLISDCYYKPTQILTMTFTNKAATEMRSRIVERLGKKQTRGLHVSTFHTFGLHFLKYEHKAVSLKSNFSILDAQDSQNLIEQIIQKEYPHFSVDSNFVQWQISSWKNDMVSADHALSQAKDNQQQTIAKLYAHYIRYLRAYNAVDFDDLILSPVHILTHNPEIKEKWQNRLRYILVDEYQDTNLSQYALLKLLCGAHTPFTFVGDDDQSIYAWRGARPDNLARLQEDYPTLKVIKLEQNYRSTQTILNAANHLIANNPHIFSKNLWSDLGSGQKIRILATKNDEEEAERVVSELALHQLKHQTRFQDYAILYRSNHQSRAIEKALRERRIPYYLSGGTSFFARSEIKDMMAYFRLLINGDDDTAFLRIANTPRREIGPNTIEKLSDYASNRQCSLLQACTELGIRQFLTEKALQRVDYFARCIIETSDRLMRGDIFSNLHDFIAQLNYETWLFEQANTPTKAQKQMDNVKDLLAWLERMVNDDELSFEDAIKRLCLLDILDRQQNNQDENQVQLMTLHAAKGLEFPFVYMIGVEEELLPHKTSIEEDSIEEERRLMYVGMTRAKRCLTLTFAQQRKRYGEWLDTKLSRFLNELPEDHVAWCGEKATYSETETQSIAKVNLEQLYKLLPTTEE